MPGAAGDKLWINFWSQTQLDTSCIQNQNMVIWKREINKTILNYTKHGNRGYIKLKNGKRYRNITGEKKRYRHIRETLAIRYLAPHRPVLACILLSKVKQRQRWNPRADKDKDKYKDDKSSFNSENSGTCPGGWRQPYPEVLSRTSAGHRFPVVGRHSW